MGIALQSSIQSMTKVTEKSYLFAPFVSLYHVCH